MSQDKNIKIARLFSLEKKAREAKTQDELNFIVSNETRQIINFINSFLFIKTPTDQFQVKASSDLATVDRTAPLISFIEDLINKNIKNNLNETQNLNIDKICRDLKISKPKNLPSSALLIPMIPHKKVF